MPEHEARRRAVYDHADDESRPAGRGRRQVADWGVGEELFDGMPGRRLDRRGDDHTTSRAESSQAALRSDRTVPSAGAQRAVSRSDRAIPRAGSNPRGGAGDGRRTIVITEDDVRFEDEAPAEEFASREDALAARRRHDEVWAGDEPFADEPAADEPSPGDTLADAVEAFEPGGRFSEEPAARREPDGIVRGGVEGRRTVKIGGRPAEFHPTSRRPSRTMHERLGPQPDRIAAWAFALGILLILIAVATANI
jgi:hypothetical protein